MRIRHPILFLLFFSLCNIAFAQSCNGTQIFTASTGVVSSPSPYANNIICRYQISPSTPASAIILRFTAFRTETNYDFVQIFQADGLRLGSYSGVISNVPLISASGGSVSILFTSDSSVIFSGWVLNYTSVAASEYPLYPQTMFARVPLTISLQPSEWIYIPVYFAGTTIVFDAVVSTNAAVSANNATFNMTSGYQLPSNGTNALWAAVPLDSSRYRLALTLRRAEATQFVGLVSSHSAVVTLVMDDGSPNWPVILGILFGVLGGVVFCCVLMGCLRYTGSPLRVCCQQSLPAPPPPVVVVPVATVRSPTPESADAEDYGVEMDTKVPGSDSAV